MNSDCPKKCTLASTSSKFVKNLYFFFLYLEHKEVLILLVSVSLHVVHLFLPFCVGLSEMTVCE